MIRTTFGVAWFSPLSEAYAEQQHPSDTIVIVRRNKSGTGDSAFSVHQRQVNLGEKYVRSSSFRSFHRISPAGPSSRRRKLMRLMTSQEVRVWCQDHFATLTQELNIEKLKSACMPNNRPTHRSGHKSHDGAPLTLL